MNPFLVVALVFGIATTVILNLYGIHLGGWAWVFGGALGFAAAELDNRYGR